MSRFFAFSLFRDAGLERPLDLVFERAPQTPKPWDGWVAPADAGCCHPALLQLLGPTLVQSAAAMQHDLAALRAQLAAAAAAEDFAQAALLKPPLETLEAKLDPARGPRHDALGTAAALAGKSLVALYFGAHHCVPCRGFVPKLVRQYVDTYRDKGLAVVYVSSDRSEARPPRGMRQHYALRADTSASASASAPCTRKKARGSPYARSCGIWLAQEDFNEFLGQQPWLALPYGASRTRS